MFITGPSPAITPAMAHGVQCRRLVACRLHGHRGMDRSPHTFAKCHTHLWIQHSRRVEKVKGRPPEKLRELRQLVCILASRSKILFSHDSLRAHLQICPHIYKRRHAFRYACRFSTNFSHICRSLHKLTNQSAHNKK